MKKKLFAVCLVVALLVVAAVGSTLAYFTDKTETAKNTFTVGKVKITLDEADIANPTGDRVTANDYTNIVPNKEYAKDPIVHVDENSQEAYVRAFITIDNAEAFIGSIPGENSVGEKFLSTLAVDSKWTCVDAATATIDSENKLTLEFRYSEAVKAGNSTTNVISSFTTPAGIGNDTLTTFHITVYAEAIQTEGFKGDLSKAFAALNDVASDKRPAATVTTTTESDEA
jgi:predicted ribosomally synthesized peptide with SipW-like signal peptide